MRYDSAENRNSAPTNHSKLAGLQALSLPRVFVLFLAGLSGWGQAATDSCTPLARTPLERLYCEITNKGEGRTLPTLEDFRRNTPQIQTLLLKRPAQKLGLKIPGPDNSAAAPTSEQASLSSQQGEPLPPEEKPPQKTSKPEHNNRHRQPDTPESENCRLSGRSLSCSGQRYLLVENQPNHSLSPNALSDTNRLQLPEWDPREELSEHQYLTQAYRTYIDKMMAIGLGAATMSFTRFYRNYQDAKVQNTDFRQRFADMYEYLKEDKKSMAPPKRLVNSTPDGIEYCDYLEKNLIVCDNGFHNWLYLAQP